jgi:hypothetical protein
MSLINILGSDRWMPCWMRMRKPSHLPGNNRPDSDRKQAE